MDFLLTSDKIPEYLKIAKESIWQSKSIFHSGALVLSILANYYKIDTLLQSQGDNFSTHILKKTIPTAKIYNYYSGTLTPKEQKKAWKKCGRKITYSNQSLSEALPIFLQENVNQKIGIFIDKHRGSADWIIPYLNNPAIKFVAIKNIGKSGLIKGNKKEQQCIKKLMQQKTYFANTDEIIFQHYRQVDNFLCKKINEWKTYSQKYPLGCGIGFFSSTPPFPSFPSLNKSLDLSEVESEPVEEEPVEEEPVEEEPVEEEPVEESVKEESVEEPVKEEPEVEPVKEVSVEESVEEPVKEEPVKEEPVKEEPVKEESVEEPVKEESVEEPVKEEPVKEEPVKEEPEVEKLVEHREDEIIDIHIDDIIDMDDDKLEREFQLLEEEARELERQLNLIN